MFVDKHLTNIALRPPEPKVVGSSPAGRSKYLKIQYLQNTVAKCVANGEICGTFHAWPVPIFAKILHSFGSGTKTQRVSGRAEIPATGKTTLATESRPR